MLAHEHEQYCDKCEALAVQAALTNEWLDKQGVPNLQALWIAYHYPSQTTTTAEASSNPETKR